MIRNVTPHNIPQELKDRDQWVCWKAKMTPGGKIGKIPVVAGNGKHAKSNDPSTWRTYEEAIKHFENEKLIAGVGFVFSEDDGFCGFDLDDCRDPETGELTEDAKTILQDLDTYCEVSPSETGVKGFCKATLPGKGVNKGQIEIYDKGRYFTVTGAWLSDYSGRIEDRQDQISALYIKVSGNNGNGKANPPGWQDETLQGVPEGQRHSAALKLAGRLAQKGLSASEIAHYIISWNNANHPPDPDLTHPENPELKKIIDFVVSKQLKGRDRALEAAFLGQKGAAELFIDEYRKQFCFDHAAGIYFRWAGCFWEPDPVGEPVAALDTVAEKFQKAASWLSGEIIQAGERLKGALDENEQQPIKAEIKQLETKRKACEAQIKNLNGIWYRKQVLEFSAAGEGSLGISGDQWDRKPWLLPCKNGVVDLKSGKLTKGKPRQFLKTACPTPYEPEARCQNFRIFLSQIFSKDRELIRFVQRVFGMALVGEVSEHVLIILHGTGRNGKDTLLETFGHVLGDLTGNARAELLLDSGKYSASGSPDSATMSLRGRRLVFTSETNEGRRLDASRVKLLTGGGTLTARAPYGRREVSFPPSHTIFLMTNHKPHANADDYALWKRIFLVPFKMAFVADPKEDHERKADKHLLSKLKAEEVGILKWMVQGCLEWQKQGLNPPEIVRVETEQYRTDEDLLETFISEECTVGTRLEERARRLYRGYEEWCERNNLKPMSGTAFGRKMTVRFRKESRKKGAFYVGVGVN